MQSYLLTDPKYTHRFKKVMLWSEFPYRADLGGGGGSEIYTGFAVECGKCKCADGGNCWSIAEGELCVRNATRVELGK